MFDFRISYSNQKKIEEDKLKEVTLNKLKNVKVAGWYQYLTEGRIIGRSKKEALGKKGYRMQRSFRRFCKK